MQQNEPDQSMIEAAKSLAETDKYIICAGGNNDHDKIQNACRKNLAEHNPRCFIPGHDLIKSEFSLIICRSRDAGKDQRKDHHDRHNDNAAPGNLRFQILIDHA